MDSLRPALRCGAAEAVCIYRRGLANMPGSRKAYGVAIEEGARFLLLTNPVEVLGNGHAAARAVRCVRQRWIKSKP